MSIRVITAIHGRFFGEIRTDPTGATRFSLVLCRYVSIPRVVWIAVDGIVGKGGMTGAIHGVFTGGGAWAFAGGLDRMSQRPRCCRMVLMTSRSSMKLMIRMVPRHFGQMSGSTS